MTCGDEVLGVVVVGVPPPPLLLPLRSPSDSGCPALWMQRRREGSFGQEVE
jgi:hypothetical protein